MKNSKELSRYARQIMLFGESGQEKLRLGKVLIAGAGGLGSAAAVYLAAAGVGRLCLVDSDVVEESNLNRQILHRVTGVKKVESAKKTLESINPHITVDAIDARIDEDNAVELVKGCDIIIDALDNFSTRYILNAAAIKSGVPLVHGAISGFEGQTMTIIPRNSSCLRCVFPKSPPAKRVPAIGATCGIIGSIQATEAIKYLLGTGELLLDRLLIWDGLSSRMEEIALQKDPKCKDCS